MSQAERGSADAASGVRPQPVGGRSRPSMGLQTGDVSFLLGAQAGLVLGVGGLFLLLAGAPEAKSALYGGGIALGSAWMLGLRVKRAAEVARRSPGSELGVLYIGALVRFVFVLLAFVVGMGALGLAPVPLLIGFGAAQLAFVINGARVRLRAARMEKLG